MAVLLLDSARVESRDRKRAKEEYVCVCVRMCTCVQGVLLFLAPGGGRSILSANFFFHLQIFQVSFYEVKLELKSPFSCCDWRLKNFIKGGRLGGCKKINYSLHDSQLSFSSSFSPKFEDSNEGKIPTIWDFIL